MKRLLAMALTLCMAVTMFTACGNKDKGSSGSDDKAASYKFAFIGPLTGDSAQYGTSLKQAAELMVKTCNDAGGINGSKVELEIFDDKNDPKEAVNIANKIVGDKSILAVCGTFASTPSLAIAPIFQKAGIPMMSPTSSHIDLTNTGDYIFRATRTQKIETGEYVRFMSDILGSKKVGMIYVQSDYGAGIKDVFEEGFKEKGGEIPVCEPYIQGQTKDFSPLISKVKAAGVDTFFIVSATYDDAAKIIKQAHSLELDAKYVCPSSVMKDEFIDLLGEEAEGVYLMSGFIPGNTDPVYVAANEAYKKAYNTEIDQFGMGSYDVMMMFIEACKEVGADRAKIKDWLLNMKDFEGSSGLYTMTENGDPLKPCYPMIIEDGKFIEYKK